MRLILLSQNQTKMRKIGILLLFFVVLLSSNPLLAQRGKGANKNKVKGHQIAIKIDGAQDSIIYLAIHYREKLMLRDSARNDGRNAFLFKGDEPYQEGLYTLVSQDRRPYLNFIIDGSQEFTYFIDTVGDVRNFNVKNSPQNEEMLRFQRKTVYAQMQIKEYQEMINKYKETDEDSLEFYNQKVRDVNNEMEQFITELIDKNPTFLFSKLQKSYRQIEVPDPPVRADGTIDSNYQAAYYRTHYWDNFDLTDNRFIYLPSLERAMNEYFNQILWLHEPDTINHYVDMVIQKTEGDSVMYRYFVERLSYIFETSKIIGHDAVFVHIANENQLKGKCYWIDEELLGRYKRRVKGLEPTLIGKIAPEIIMPDTSFTTDFNQWHSSYNMKKPYVILWFYDPACHTCKTESEHLRAVYDSLEAIGQRNFDVYAIGSDSDTERLKKYIKEKNYPWLNVGGNSANIDYIAAFNIIGNPTMFIFDNKTRKIILNKRIEMSAIPIFLEQHEKIEKMKQERMEKQ